jgi:GxxExxY protein
MRKYSEFAEITATIIGCAIEVHRHLGPGLLESTYQTCLIYELEEKGLSLQTEIGLPIIYKKIIMDHGYRIDILVENTVVLELKAVEFFSQVHYAQILTYMTLGKHPVGFLLNFHVKMLKEGIKRFVL